MTVWNYDQTFLKRTSNHATIKIFFLQCIWQISGSPFYISWEKYCSYCFATEKLLPWVPLDLLEGVNSTHFHFLHWMINLTWPGIQEGVLFVSWVVLVVCMLCQMVKSYWQYIINLGTSWRWVVSFSPWLFYPRRNNPGTHKIQSCVCPRAGMNAFKKKKICLIKNRTEETA